MVDAGPEPTYAEKMRVLPTPWGVHMCIPLSKAGRSPGHTCLVVSESSST